MMKLYYMTAVVMLLLIVLGIVLMHMRRKRAIRKVCARTDEEKIRDLNHALEPYGFLYDKEADCFFSAMYPWQRKMGYCRFYDEAAPSMNMIIDCEPIYFEYKNKFWLIEVWKGQYGMTVGAEIGIYYADKRNYEKPEDLFYESVSDKERMWMRFVLRRGKRVLLKRSGYHWWLTGFLPGLCMEKRELCMEVQISFPNIDMREAFLEGLYAAGYDEEEIFVQCNLVSFCFCHPRTWQPHKYCNFFIQMKQRQNCRNCKRYEKVTRPFTRTIDKMDYLRFCFPVLYRLLIRIGKMRVFRRLHKRYKKRPDVL